jgi:hypothetical protein
VFFYFGYFCNFVDIFHRGIMCFPLLFFFFFSSFSVYSDRMNFFFLFSFSLMSLPDANLDVIVVCARKYIYIYLCLSTFLSHSCIIISVYFLFFSCLQALDLCMFFCFTC